MKSFSERLYSSSPVWIQNILISAYGYKLFYKRYLGTTAKRVRQDIKNAEALSETEKRDLQSELLNKMLTFCSESVPYYQNLFAEYGYTPNQFTSLNDLSKLPILNKQTLKENSSLFIPTKPSTFIDSSPFMLQTTSGSTGTPLKLQVNEYTYKLAMQLLVVHEENCGVKFGARRATFAGRLIQPVENKTPPFWRYNKAENQFLFSSYHLNHETFPHYKKALDKVKPQELIGYPSAIAELASFYINSNVRPEFKPQAIITNSETLLDWQRTRIEQVFDTKVYDYYGTAEYVIFAGQSIDGLYHPNPLIGVLELSQADQESEISEVIATSLCNTAMPLIRYKLGDTAKASKDNPALIEQFRGRIDDYITKTDGTKIGRIDHIFKGIEGIREAQVIQTNRNKCLIKVVPLTSTFTQMDQLTTNFKERLGNDMNLELEILDVIPKGKNGKFKSVIGLQP